MDDQADECAPLATTPSNGVSSSVEQVASLTASLRLSLTGERRLQDDELIQPMIKPNVSKYFFLRMSLGSISMFILSALLVTGFAVLFASSKTYMNGTPETVESYFFCLIPAIGQACIFGVWRYVVSMCNFDLVAGEDLYPQSYLFSIGVWDALATVGRLYAGESDRVSDSIKVTANLLLIPVVFALRKGLLHRRISQAQGTVASLCFFVSLYAIAPSLTEHRPTDLVTGATRYLWPVGYLLCTLPLGMQWVIQEGVLQHEVPSLRLNQPSRRDFEARYLNLVWFLWWTSLYRMLTIFALGFVMFVPNVGKTTSIPDLFSQMTISLQCVFQGKSGCTPEVIPAYSLHWGIQSLLIVVTALVLRSTEGASYLAMLCSLATVLEAQYWVVVQYWAGGAVHPGIMTAVCAIVAVLVCRYPQSSPSSPDGPYNILQYRATYLKPVIAAQGYAPPGRSPLGL